MYRQWPEPVSSRVLYAGAGRCPAPSFCRIRSKPALFCRRRTLDLAPAPNSCWVNKKGTHMYFCRKMAYQSVSMFAKQKVKKKTDWAPIRKMRRILVATPKNNCLCQSLDEFPRAGKKLDSYNTVYNHQGLTHARVLGDAC